MHEVAHLQDELSRRSGKRVLLCLTDNRRRMVSARVRGSGLVELRLQRIFLESPPEVIDDLADLLAGRATRRQALRAFVDERFREKPGETDAGTARASRPRPAPEQGDVHDIVGMAEELNTLYLGRRSRAGVVWGRRNRTRNRRSIRFGCYDPARNLITMNRKLDSPDIPAYFVEFILFHEMLHEVLGIDSRPDGRRNIHGRLFKLMEKTYPDYDKALRFERELCERLGSL